MFQYYVSNMILLTSLLISIFQTKIRNNLNRKENIQLKSIIPLYHLFLINNFFFELRKYSKVFSNFLNLILKYSYEKKKKIHDKKYVYNRYVLIQYISPRNLNRFP